MSTLWNELPDAICVQSNLNQFQRGMAITADVAHVDPKVLDFFMFYMQLLELV